MGKQQTNTGKGSQTVNTNSVWDRIVGIESKLTDIATNRRDGINITQPPYNCSVGTDISAKMVDIWSEANSKKIPIIIPSGTFTIAFSPALDNVTVIGSGAGKTFLKSPNGSVVPLNLSPRKNIKLVGITFDGNKSVSPNGNVAVECGSSENISFYDCEFTNAADSGARISDSDGVAFEKCKFTNNGVSSIEANGGDGIITYGYRVDNLRVINCDFTGNWRNGISLDVVLGGKATIDNCTFTGNTRGIHIEECDITFNAKISNCHAYSNKGTAYGANNNYGFYVGGNVVQFFNVSFKGCTATDNNYGILLYNAEGVRIVDCDLYGNTAAGISFGTSYYNMITGGSIINNGLYGINSAFGFEANIFQNVLIGDTRTGGSKTQTYGVVLKTYDGQNKFIGCTFYGNITSYVQDGQDVSVTEKTAFINCKIV